jgi:hypothetical protein
VWEILLVLEYCDLGSLRDLALQGGLLTRGEMLDLLVICW